MSRQRRWPWILLALVVVAGIVAALVLPRLLDVERHRGRIEAALGDATGWNAQLGRLDVAVLRGLAVTVSPVRLESPSGGSFFDAETIEIRGAILPLLRGRLEIRTIRLVRPRIELVRETLDEGWSLPLPDEGRDAAGAPGEAGSGIDVSIDEISVTDGVVRLEDRSAEPPWTAEVSDLDTAIRPSSGDLSGQATLAGGGEVRWTGNLSQIDLALQTVPTELVAAWIGEELVRPGGLVSGAIKLSLPDHVEGELDLEHVQVLAGEQAFPRSDVGFTIGARDGGWELERFRLEAVGASITGSGRLSPDLALRFELPDTDLASTLALTRGLFPLPLDLTPPGRADVAIDVEMPAGGELRYAATGAISAAGFLAGEFLPAATDLVTRFELSREGALDLELTRASVAGGPLSGTVRIDRIDPPGNLIFDGRLSEAGLGQLLGGLVEDAGRLAGPVGLEARLVLDLGADVIGPSALTGRLALVASQVTLPGWDLEQAVRAAVQDKLGALAALVGGAGADDPARADAATRLVDRLGASIEFDSVPWTFETFEIVAGHIEARGRGTFDPSSGSVDVELAARLDPELTARYVERHGALRSLVGQDGQLEVPLKIRGPLVQPSIDVRLGELGPLRGTKPKEALKGLLEGLIDRDRSRKD